METTGRGPLVALVCRVALGAWFAYSGALKVFAAGLERFTRDVANYRLVGEPWDAVVAYTLPWAEMVAGLCLVLGFWRRGAILMVAAMVLAFSAGIGWAWSQGLDISCGCRLSEEPMHYGWKAAELVAYFAVLGFLWRSERWPIAGAVAAH